MKATIIPSVPATAKDERMPVLAGLAKRAVLAQLRRLRCGQLKLVDGDHVDRFGRLTPDVPLAATIHVHSPRFYPWVAFGGSVGAGEAYMLGMWSCDDLTSAVRILLRNRHVLDGMEQGLARLLAPVRGAFHWLNRNTVSGSRRNISAHYDLGNSLFELFLDETMMYSSGIFERPEATLKEASLAKIDRICRKLELRPQDHLLEIGTGWGGFAIAAAREFGCRVTTTTISAEQYGLAVQRVREAGLEDRVEVLFEDYRALSGHYDKLVSIEMLEAVGHRYYDTYFRKCSELLKPDGMMLLQAITIADQRYDEARRSVDFIQRYIFPGSCIPSVNAIASAVAGASDMRIFHLEDIGPHYALTLRRWRERFFENIETVLELGYPAIFARMWEFYLSYCEGGFRERAIGNVQVLLTKPQCRRASLIPALS